MAPRRLSDSRADAERSFEQLYRGHRNDVYRAALRALGNSEDAEDVTQAAFVDAYRAVLRGTRPQAPRAWLLTIAENVRRRRFRTSLRRPREEPLDADAALAAEESHEQASIVARCARDVDDRAARGVPPPRDHTASRTTRSRSRWARRSPPCRCCCSARGGRSATSSSRRTSYGALFPLATLFSRLESFSLTPRAAGAVGAAVVAVERERQRAGQCRSRAHEPGSDAAGRGRPRCCARTGRGAGARPRGRNRCRRGRLLLRSDAPRAKAPIPVAVQPAAQSGRHRCRPDSSARAGRPAARAAARAGAHACDTAGAARGIAGGACGVAGASRARCRRRPCPGPLRCPRCSRRSSSHCSRMPARRAPLGSAPYRCQCGLSTRCRPYRDER